MNRNLEYVLEQVNRWLAFAEAKNAMIIIINITLIIAEINLIFNETSQVFILDMFILSISLLGVSSITVLYSFLPFTGKITNNVNVGKEHSELNLVHYGDISKIDNVNEYLKLSFERYSPQRSDKASNFEIDLVSEILTNSQITMKKLKLFKAATWITITSVLLPLVGLGITLLQKVG